MGHIGDYGFLYFLWSRAFQGWNVDPEARAVRKRFDDEVDAVVRRDGATIDRARFARSGFTQPPDATFTLRLSYGTVKGYEENGKKIPYFTTIGGAFQHARRRPSRSLSGWKSP